MTNTEALRRRMSQIGRVITDPRIQTSAPTAKHTLRVWGKFLSPNNRAACRDSIAFRAPLLLGMWALLRSDTIWPSLLNIQTRPLAMHIGVQFSGNFLHFPQFCTHWITVLDSNQLKDFVTATHGTGTLDASLAQVTGSKQLLILY